LLTTNSLAILLDPLSKPKPKYKNKHTMTEAQRESAVYFVDHCGLCHACLPPRGLDRRLRSCQVRPAADSCFWLCCYANALIQVLLLIQQVVTFARQAEMEQLIVQSAAAMANTERLWAFGSMKCMPGMVLHGMGIQWTQMVADFTTKIPKPFAQTGPQSVFMRCLSYGMGIVANHSRAEMSKTMTKYLPSIPVDALTMGLRRLVCLAILVLAALWFVYAVYFIVLDVIKVIIRAFSWIVILAFTAIDPNLGIAAFAVWYFVIPMMIWLPRAVRWTVRSIRFVMTTERHRLASLTARNVLLLPFTLAMWTPRCIIWVASSINSLLCCLIPGYGLFCWLVGLNIRVMVSVVQLLFRIVRRVVRN
jgi:hypothetical protein